MINLIVEEELVSFKELEKIYLPMCVNWEEKSHRKIKKQIAKVSNTAVMDRFGCFCYF